MTAQPLLPFRTSRKNRLFTCAVIAVAGIATAGIAATLQPARADVTAEDALVLPPAMIVASADTPDGPRGFRGPEQKGPARAQIDKKLTNDQVKDIVQGRIAMTGNANLKVGKIAPKEDGVVSVDITTKTGALVDTQEISTRTGLPADRERRFGEMHERFRDHGARGPGMMAQHRGPGGPGMDHGGDHGGDRGVNQDAKAKDLALTTDQAKKLAEARLIMRGNPHLKVGAVKEKDADTISIDIVASDNSLVSQQLIDRHTGRPQRMGRS